MGRGGFPFRLVTGPFAPQRVNGVNDATYMSNPSNSIVLDITRPHGGSVRSGGPPSRPGSDFRYRESNPVPVASKRRRSWKEPVGVEPTAGGVLSKRSTTRSGSSLKNFALLFTCKVNESLYTRNPAHCVVLARLRLTPNSTATGEPRCVVLARLRLTPSLCCGERCTSGGTYIALIARGMDSIATTRGPLGAVVIEPPASAIRSRRSTNRANRPAKNFALLFPC